MPWTKLTTGPHAGKTLPEVMLSDPDYVFGAARRGEFGDVMLAEATKVCRRAARIRIPREEEAVAFFHLLPDGKFGGFTIVARSDPRLGQYRKFSAAESEHLDLSIPGRIAPNDPQAVKVMLGGVLFQFFGDPKASLTPEECAGFFSDPECIAN
jgi:hypothetical protein